MTARAFERMDAMSSETTSEGLPVAYGKVASFVLTGNEDGVNLRKRLDTFSFLLVRAGVQ